MVALAFSVGISPALAQEACADGADDDGDGAIDCLDADCASGGGQFDTDGDGTDDACDACADPGDGRSTFHPETRIGFGNEALVVLTDDLDGDLDPDVLA